MMSSVGCLQIHHDKIQVSISEGDGVSSILCDAFSKFYMNVHVSSLQVEGHQLRTFQSRLMVISQIHVQKGKRVQKLSNFQRCKNCMLCIRSKHFNQLHLIQSQKQTLMSRQKNAKKWYCIYFSVLCFWPLRNQSFTGDKKWTANIKTIPHSLRIKQRAFDERGVLKNNPSN